jgi:dimethylsulfone monooxygenase
MQQRTAMYNGNALKIGLFGANCSSGRAVTRVAERWSGSWPDNVRLARIADEAGIDTASWISLDTTMRLNLFFLNLI